VARRANYGFEKRQKEIQRQKKREEKAEKKRQRKESGEAGSGPEIDWNAEVLGGDGSAPDDQAGPTAAG
jgi:hypothetical protein